MERNYGTFYRLAVDVATELGFPWKAQGNDERSTYSFNIVNIATGASLYLDFNASKGYDNIDRLTLSGSLRIGNDWQTVYAMVDGSWKQLDSPKISVSLSKEPAKIAADIKRRLLPEYERVFALAQDKVRKDKEYEDRKAALLLELAIAAGKANTRDLKEGFYKSFDDYVGSTVEVKTYDNLAQLEISTSIAKAKRIFAILQEVEVQ